MPRIEAVVVVSVDPATAFAVSQTTGDLRLRWDPFIRRQHLLDGALEPGKGVRTYTRSRHGLRMISQYVSYNPPRNVGMTMRQGPWFFATFAGGWRFEAADGGTRPVWKYSFTCRPSRPYEPRLGSFGVQRPAAMNGLEGHERRMEEHRPSVVLRFAATHQPITSNPGGAPLRRR